MDTALDVIPDLFGFVAVQTQCDWCDKVVPLRGATVTTHHITPYITEVEHFCSDQCATKAWSHRSGVDV